MQINILKQKINRRDFSYRWKIDIGSKNLHPSVTGPFLVYIRPYISADKEYPGKKQANVCCTPTVRPSRLIHSDSCFKRYDFEPLTTFPPDSTWILQDPQ